jgi:hypothetical protein
MYLVPDGRAIDKSQLLTGTGADELDHMVVSGTTDTRGRGRIRTMTKDGREFLLSFPGDGICDGFLKSTYVGCFQAVCGICGICIGGHDGT